MSIPTAHLIWFEGQDNNITIHFHPHTTDWLTTGNTTNTQPELGLENPHTAYLLSPLTGNPDKGAGITSLASTAYLPIAQRGGNTHITNTDVHTDLIPSLINSQVMSTCECPNKGCWEWATKEKWLILVNSEGSKYRIATQHEHISHLCYSRWFVSS